MKLKEIADLVVSSGPWRRGTWWEREAAKACDRDDFLVITGRSDSDVYMVRFWLSAAVRRESASNPDDESIESGESLLLHYFARGDDDQALHDHPWNFRTSILDGGYVEHLPPIDWVSSEVDGNPDGPAWNVRTIARCTGQTIEHRATDLHCVGQIEPGTWTLVRTGPRFREWGFHPPGQRWVPFRKFLDAKKPSAAEVAP